MVFRRKKLLTQTQLKTLKNQSIRSINFTSSTGGDTTINIETDGFKIILGANDLGAWLEKIVREKLKPVIKGKL